MTETKRCVTIQFVVDEAGGAFVVVGAGGAFGVVGAGGAFVVVGAVGVDCEEEELPPPHVVNISTAVVSRISLIVPPVSGPKSGV